LASIPAWEDDTGHPFLVHGESILQILTEAVSAADLENRRKPPRAGSVPPRSTTPVNSLNHYIPGSASYSTRKAGPIIPTVRPGSSMSSNSAPNKRQRVGEAKSGRHVSASGEQQRAPLATNRGQVVNVHHQRAMTPASRSGKTPTKLPRPVAMPIPKSGVQHHLLGYGKYPSDNGPVYGTGSRQPSRTTSAMSTRIISSSVLDPNAAKKASRARRESFKPGPSVDCLEVGKGIGMRGQ